MMTPQRRPLAFVRLLVFIGLASILFSFPQHVFAQHRAEVSRGLDEQIASGAPGLFRVLVGGPQAEMTRLSDEYGLEVIKRLEMGALLSGTSAQFERVANDPAVSALVADDVVVGTMGVASQSTGANLLWSGEGGFFDGLVGRGVGVAVLDSGVSLHPDVSRRVTLRLNFVTDTAAGDLDDAFGHGTHVASIIAGSGAGSLSAGGTSYVGMAPGAELVSLRVLGADGTGYVSDVVQAIEWAIRHGAQYKLRVLNLSLGHLSTTSYRHDPLAQAVERAVRSGLVVVASAGNLGKDEQGNEIVGGIVSPGYTPGALTVAALNTRGTVIRSDDVVASYASRGPVGDPERERTWEIKPDLVAPGNAIVAAGAVGSYIWTNYPERRVAGSSNGTYLVLSGSSMAAAVVSGAVAQLLQAAPELTPVQVKAVLQLTAQQLDGVALVEQGAGSLNVPLAVALATVGNFADAPTGVEIGGELVEAGDLAFTSTTSWGRTDALSGGLRVGNTVIWNSQSLQGNTIIWGNRGTGANGTIIWGNRGTGANGTISQ
jgi:subtilisin family serine protease